MPREATAQQPRTGERTPPETGDATVLLPYFVLSLLVMGAAALLGSGAGIDPWTGVVTFLGCVVAIAVITGLSRLGRP